MPVRPFSVGSLFIVSTLAILAARGTAAAKDEPKVVIEPDEEAAADPKREPASPGPDVKLEAKPPPLPAAPAPAPAETVGFSDRLFVRSPGGEVVVFPGARVQVDGAAFPRQTPKSGVFIRRARVGMRGWLGRIFYFDTWADFTPLPPDADALAPAALSPTDTYIALAPLGDRLILQAGQFDAPFTLENRTSDAYTIFIERAMAVRSLAVPRNKEVGVMLHGLLGGGVLYYSGGVFNGNGPNFRNIDNQPDAIGRIVLSPFGGGDSAFRRLGLGGSGWYGRHVLGPTFPVQATPGGLPYLEPVWMTGQPARTLEMREHGTVTAFAGELSIPFGTRFGVRAEGVYKRQRIAETEVVANGPLTVLGSATLEGIAGYGEMWLWLAGDDRMLPAPGLQLPDRTDTRYRRAFEEGLMLAVRGDFLKEDLVSNQPTLGNPTRATTRVVAGTVGANYWRGSFARISINYVVNMWSGTSETIKALRAQSLLEHELLLRFAISL